MTLFRRSRPSAGEAEPQTKPDSGPDRNAASRPQTPADDQRAAAFAADRMARFVPKLPRRQIDLPGAPSRTGDDGDDGRRLLVSREISINGSIAECDVLIVEGMVEAKLEDARLLDITEGGRFNGAVDVREAVIAGTFHGTLTVTDMLTVKPTGRIEGTLHCRRIAVEPGGEIDGEIDFLPDLEDAPPNA